MNVIQSALLVPILAYGLTCGLARAEQSSKPTPQQNDTRRLMITVLEKQCEKVLTKTPLKTADGKEISVYEASNEMLHQCQYVVEMKALGCAPTFNCASYEAWTASVTALDVDRPKEVFVKALERRQADLTAKRAK